MDIISLPIEHDNEEIEGSYRLVMASVLRAKALALGALPVKKSKARKITTLAIEEVATKMVTVLSDSSAVKAREDAKEMVHKRVMDEAQQKETMPEDITELEKDLKVYLSEKSGTEQKKTIEDIFGDN